MIHPITIIKATPDDHEILTQIAFAAKRHWNYPESYYKRWQHELTITKDYIQKNMVFKAINRSDTIGFYSIIDNPADRYAEQVFVPKGIWLEHIFIKPEFHHLGIGRKMIEHVKLSTCQMGSERLLVFVDPLARGFYDKIGASFLYDSNSSIPGRQIPVYELMIRS